MGASTDNYVKRMQDKLMQKRAATHARTYGGQLEANRNAPRRTPPASTSDYVKRMQDKKMQERARPGYGQYHQRRRMPAAPQISSRIKALGLKLQQERAKHGEGREAVYREFEASRNAPRRTPSPQTSPAIKAIQMKLQQERAAILAKYPEYKTWAEYEADMTPGMIRH